MREVVIWSMVGGGGGGGGGGWVSVSYPEFPGCSFHNY